MNISENQKLGKDGEDIAFNLLERALDCKVHRPKHDRGLDGTVEFIPYISNDPPQHFAVQIKTGFHYVKNRGKTWEICNLDRRDIEKWQSSTLPVVFIWVHPEENNKAYWHVVTNRTSKKHFFIPKSRYITPCFRSELLVRLTNINVGEQSKKFKSLVPPLSGRIRDTAKSYYRSLILDTHSKIDPVNPVLGPVRLSWHGWRHISSQTRRIRNIFHSFQLLPALKWVIEHPSGQPNLGRRYKHAQAGRWITSTMLVIFRSRIEIEGRADAQVIYALRETLMYPVAWVGVPKSEIQRSVVFHSIYEKE